MIVKVQKRDDSIVDYDLAKISLAIGKAGNSTKEFDKKITNSLTRKVDVIISQLNKEVISVEDIQDIVEATLLASKYKQSAKSYILYRDQHAKLRDVTTVANIDLIDHYLDKTDWQVKENSNMSYSLQGLNNYISSEITKTYWLNKVYPKNIRDLHTNGDIHIHDLNTFAVYCVGWDLHDLLIRGYGGVPGKLNSAPAKHLRTALGQAVNFLYTLQGECYSDDTEVLTDSGWKFFNDLSGDEQFITQNIETKNIELQYAIKHFKYFKDGKLINFKNNKLDLLITEDHNMLILEEDHKSEICGYDLNFIKAKDFNPNTNFIPTGPMIPTEKLELCKIDEESITYVDYTGYVYCVEVPNHTLYVRRNGKATWCGNCAGAQAFSNFDTLLAPFIRYDDLTHDEVKQAMQEFIFNLNVPTRTGFQSPFSNITMDLKVPPQFKDLPVIIGGEPQKETYSDFQEEIDIFNSVFTEVMTEGDSMGRVFTFPIPTYNITKDFDWDNKNLDGLWEMTAKYGIPYFSNFINSDMKPEDARSMAILGNQELIYKKENGHVSRCPIKNIVAGWINNKEKPNIKILMNGEFIDIIDMFEVPYENYKSYVSIELDNGYLQNFSYQHKCAVVRDDELVEVESQDIKITDKFLISRKGYEGNSLLGDHQSGKILGYYLGEGWKETNSDSRISFAININRTDIVDEINNFFTKMVCDVKIVPWEDKHIYKVTISGKHALGFVKNFIRGEKAIEKRLESSIWNTSLEFRKGLLEGLYQTDGYIPGKILTHTTNKEIIMDLIHLANSVGKILKYKVNNKNSRYFKKDKSDLVFFKSYKLYFTEYKETFELDGEEYAMIPVKSVDEHDSKANKVYNFTVNTDRHLYELPNGIITHQCCRLRLDVKTLEKRGGGLFGSNPLTGCYSSDTEVLTDEGWKLFTELNHNEKVLSRDKDTGIESWDKPSEYFEYDYVGDMIHFNKSDELDLLVTPDHRMLIETSSGSTVIKFAKDVVETDGIPNKYETFKLKEDDIQHVDYNGKVYCLKVKNGIFYVRRNGKACWSGNSIGVVTINLPRLGFLSTTKEEFTEKLLELIDAASESLEIKRKVLENYTEQNLYPYIKHYLDAIYARSKQYWINHFSTIGIVGMNEACLNFLGEDITSENGMAFSLEVCDIIRNKLVEIQETTGNNYNFEATPAEGTSYRLSLMDKKQYPDIICADEEAYASGAEPFYTNSTQLPVNFTDDIFEIFDRQDELQQKYTGGTVIHVYVGEKIHDYTILKNLVKKLCEQYHTPYFTITPTFSICPTHGYIAGEYAACPTCEMPTEIYSRVTGYIRPINQWNAGKRSEFEKRKTVKI